MKKNILSMAVLLMASATVFTACSSDDNIISEQPINPTGKYTMTVNASKGDDAQTRGLSLSGKTLSVKWAATDEVSVFPTAWSRTPYGTLTAAASDNGSTSLTGDLTSAPTAGDQLNLLFPRATWDYTGQTGVLLSDANSIEKKYDYALANVEVASVGGNTITTTGNASFASQQAIVKFILKNKSDNSSLNASSLTVSAASNKLVTGKGYNVISRHSGYTYDNGSAYADATSNLVDGNTGTKWCSNPGHKTDGKYFCEFHTASPVRVDGYTLTTGTDNETWNGRNPKDWVLKAKANSSDAWTTIATVTNDATMQDKNTTPYDFDVDTPGEYQYFRIEISSTRGGDGTMQLGEMQLFAKNYGTAYGDLTVTPASVTNEIFVALRNENGSADTYKVSANVGGKKYAFSKSGATFQNGNYYEITVKMTEQAASNVTWNFSEMSEEHADLNMGYTYKGVTLSGMGDLNFENGSLYVMGDLTFTNTLDKHFKKIVITATGMANISGWTNGGEPDNWTSTWTGDASSVTIDASSMADRVTSIVFTLE